MNEFPENLVISTKLAQEVLNFLVQQPYGAVANLVQGLQQLQPATEKQVG